MTLLAQRWLDVGPTATRRRWANVRAVGQNNVGPTADANVGPTNVHPLGQRWPNQTLLSGLVPEFVYRASQRSHGTLINPGIQVGCQWKLTWSYKQSTPHMYHTQSAATQIGVTSLYALQDNKNIPAYTHPHSTSLRASHDQQYRVPHTTNPIDAYTYSFFPRTISIWNILPAALVHASTIEGFKNGLQKEFLSGNMYRLLFTHTHR